jgi:Rod binding domain-containing protein
MSLSIASEIVRFPALPDAGKVKAEKAAQDFESILLGSLLESLQKSFAGSSEDSPAGSDNYALMGTQALASAISAHGGIGLGKMILQQWRQTKVPEMRTPEVSPAT